MAKESSFLRLAAFAVDSVCLSIINLLASYRPNAPSPPSPRSLLPLPSCAIAGADLRSSKRATVFPTPESFSPPTSNRPRRAHRAECRIGPAKTDGASGRGDEWRGEERRGEESSSAQPWKLLLIDGSRSRSFSFFSLLMFSVTLKTKKIERGAGEEEEEAARRRRRNCRKRSFPMSSRTTYYIHVYPPLLRGGVNCPLDRRGLFKRVGRHPPRRRRQVR